MQDGTDEPEPLVEAQEPSLNTGAINVVARSIDYTNLAGFRGGSNGAPPTRGSRGRKVKRIGNVRRHQSRVTRTHNLLAGDLAPLPDELIEETTTPNAVEWTYERIVRDQQKASGQ